MTFFGPSVAWIIATLVGAFVQAFLTRAVVANVEGERADFGDCIATGFRFSLPVLAIGLLAKIGMGIGLVLLIIPGIMAAVIWSVAIPAAVVERTGVIGSFGRSRDLTRGSRWKVLGLILVALVAYSLFSGLLAVFGLAFWSGPRSIAPISTAALAANILSGTLGSLLWGTIQPSLYFELRHATEGNGMDSLEDIFA